MAFRLISVDGLIKQFDLGKIDLLRADVQEAEFDMLVGADRALRSNRIGYVFISTHGYEHERCVSHLTTYGYRMIAVYSMLESFSGDGLIVARAPEYLCPDRIDISVKRYASLNEYDINFRGCVRL